MLCLVHMLIWKLNVYKQIERSIARKGKCLRSGVGKEKRMVLIKSLIDEWRRRRTWDAFVKNWPEVDQFLEADSCYFWMTKMDYPFLRDFLHFAFSMSHFQKMLNYLVRDFTLEPGVSNSNHLSKSWAVKMVIVSGGWLWWSPILSSMILFHL